MRWAAFGLAIIIAWGAFIYSYPSLFGASHGPSITFTFSTTSTSRSSTKRTTSTQSPLHSVIVKSALLVDDVLKMDAKNTGTLWTKNLTVAGICTPGFKSCYSYDTLSGHSLTGTFALAPQAEYVYNVPGICVVPVASCTQLYPVANSSYYFEVSIGYASGVPTLVQVTARASNTYPLSAAVQGLAYQLDTFPKNGSGRLTVNISMNSSLSSANFIVSMLTRLKTGGFTQRLLYKTIGCGGNSPVDCSSGNLIMIKTFSTVQTGIGTPIYLLPYLLTVRDLTVRGTVYFAVWVPALNK